MPELRPHFNWTTDRLASQASEHWNDPQRLRLFAAELSHRRRTRARMLLNSVLARIKAFTAPQVSGEVQSEAADEGRIAGDPVSSDDPQGRRNGPAALRTAVWQPRRDPTHAVSRSESFTDRTGFASYYDRDQSPD